MKRAFYILALMFFFAGCASSLYPDYTLTKKYPRDIPDLELKILNDTTGVVMQPLAWVFLTIRRKVYHFLQGRVVSIYSRLCFASKAWPIK